MRKKERGGKGAYVPFVTLLCKFAEISIAWLLSILLGGKGNSSTGSHRVRTAEDGGE